MIFLKKSKEYRIMYKEKFLEKVSICLMIFLMVYCKEIKCCSGPKNRNDASTNTPIKNGTGKKYMKQTSSWDLI